MSWLTRPIDWCPDFNSNFVNCNLPRVLVACPAMYALRIYFFFLGLKSITARVSARWKSWKGEMYQLVKRLFFCCLIRLSHTVEWKQCGMFSYPHFIVSVRGIKSTDTKWTIWNAFAYSRKRCRLRHWYVFNSLIKELLSCFGVRLAYNCLFTLSDLETHSISSVTRHFCVGMFIHKLYLRRLEPTTIVL